MEESSTSGDRVDRRWIHWVLTRTLRQSIAEDVLQGSPGDYLWGGDRAQHARQIGNALPVQLDEVIGRPLLCVLS